MSHLSSKSSWDGARSHRVQLAADTGEGRKGSMIEIQKETHIRLWRSMGNTLKMRAYVRAKPANDTNLTAAPALPGGWGDMNGILKRSEEMGCAGPS